MQGRSFVPLFVTNFLGTMNDNFLKGLASFIVIDWIADPALKPVFMGAVAAALVLPFVLCSPLADRLTVVFPKRRVLRLAKTVELPLVLIGVAGFVFHSAALVVASVTLMGLQSSLYSPSKYALVRDVGGADRISTGMGGMEGIAFLGMLSGTIAAAYAVDNFQPAVRYAVLAALAVLGYVASCLVKADEEPNRNVHSINPVRYFLRSYRMARGYTGLNAVIVTLSVFWFAASMLQMGLVVYGKEVLGLGSTETGVLLCAAAVGIVAGQVLAGLVDRRHYLLGATPLTGLLAAALLAVLFFVPMGKTAFGITLGLLAFDLGFFKLPLDAEIQKVVKGPRLNTMLAYFNMVSFLFMMLASGVYALVSWAAGPRAFLALLALVMLVTPFALFLRYRPLLLFVGRWILARRYAVTVEGMDGLKSAAPITAPATPESPIPNPDSPIPNPESPIPNPQSPTTNYHLPSTNYHLPSTDSLLVLPNHPAMVDPMLVGATFWKTPLKPLVDELFFHTGFLAPRALKTLGAVAVPDLRAHRSKAGASIARGLSDIVVKALQEGDNVIFYPSGHIYTEDRESIGTRQLAYNVVKALPANVRVIGVRTTGLWGSIWSRKGRTSSPKFVPTLLKSVFLWFFYAPFAPRRKVTMHVEDLTEAVREWSDGTRLEFNRELEKWYNGDKFESSKV